MTGILAYSALAAWNLQDATCTLAAHRENKVYRIQSDGKTYALRLHRPGYRTDAELRSELAWMTAVQSSSLSIPAPIPAANGDPLAIVDGQQFDLITWLSGRQLGASGTPLDLENPTKTFYILGQSMAQLHAASDAWTPPSDFTRPAWDSKGLLGETPLWGRFWENPTLTDEQSNTLSAFRIKAKAALDTSNNDYGLIHADLLRENILVDGDSIHLIDFDDGGPGFRLFELATTLFRIKDEPNYSALRRALINGYLSTRPLDTTHLPLFTALRACTYVGWIVTRMDIPNATDRNKDHIKNALEPVTHWLATEASHV